MNPERSHTRPKLQSFRKLECGGSILTSPDGKMVHRIVREFSEERPVVIVLLCPPKEKGDHSDIEPWVSFAKASGFGRLTVIYLFPHRAADLNDIRKHGVPWGGKFNREIWDIEVHRADREGGRIIAAWGPNGSHDETDKMFLRRFDGTPGPFSPYPRPIVPIQILSQEAVAA